MLIVCHCYRGTDDIIRIISAMKATKSETEQYGELIKDGDFVMEEKDMREEYDIKALNPRKNPLLMKEK